MANEKYNARVFSSEIEQNAYQAVAAIDKIRVGHIFFDGAVRGIRECMKESEYAREPANCMLLGEGGMGKTSVANMIVQSMKPEVIVEDDLEIRTIPAFYTSFRSSKSLDALTADMLTKLDDPNPNSGRVDDKASRVLELLVRCRTKIIFVDELHDLDGFETKESREMRILLKWIKAITNGGGPLTCLMGIENCHNIFEGNPEMARRFKRKLFLRPLNVGTREKPGLLQGFLRDVYGAVTAKSPIKSFPEAGYLQTLQIFLATGGSLDFIMTLIKQAVLRALLEGRSHVDVSDYAAVWDQAILDDASVVPFNPFIASESQLATAVRERQS